MRAGDAIGLVEEAAPITVPEGRSDQSSVCLRATRTPPNPAPVCGSGHIQQAHHRSATDFHRSRLTQTLEPLLLFPDDIGCVVARLGKPSALDDGPRERGLEVCIGEERHFRAASGPPQPAPGG